MRILMDYRPALRQRTGAGEYVDRLARALQRRLASQDSLTLFSSSWKDRLPNAVVPGTRQVDARVPVSVLNFAWHRLQWPPVDWLSGRVDVAQSMHPLLLPARAAARFVTVHDLYFLDNPGQTPAEIRRDYPGLAAIHARSADGVIVSSSYTRSLVEHRLGVPAERITICSPGAPDWPVRDDPASPGPILFVGTIEPRKNVPGLLQAYARLRRILPDAPVLMLAGRLATVIGSGESLENGSVGDGVKILGYVADEERLALYRRASMLVLPSFDEGFGLPVLEAMALGVPVVAARRGALPEVLGDAGLLVEPDDHAGIAAAMHSVLTDPLLRQRMRESGIERAKTYSWTAAADRLYAAYAGALGRRTRA